MSKCTVWGQNNSYFILFAPYYVFLPESCIIVSEIFGASYTIHNQDWFSVQVLLGIGAKYWVVFF